MFNILNLIYPNVCGICNKIYKESICTRCQNHIKEFEINANLHSDKKYFDEGISIYEYKEIVRDKIIDYKFNNNSYLYKMFGEIILKNEKICGILEKYDIIIPVPLSKKRMAKRGYNQTELIAKYIAKNNNKIKLGKNILVKTKNIESQSNLKKQERIKNIKNAFNIKNKEKIFGKNIILFDDIYTTGSTVNECCRILKKAKVNRIFVLTLAKD